MIGKNNPKNIYSASARFKSSPYKVDIIVDLIKGLKVQDAVNQLLFCRKSVAAKLCVLLKSAMHNAENNFGAEISDLKVSNILVGPSLKLKRLYTRARGRADFKYKRYSNVTINLV